VRFSTHNSFNDIFLYQNNCVSSVCIYTLYSIYTLHVHLHKLPKFEYLSGLWLMAMTRMSSLIMLQYGLAEDTMRSGKPDVAPNELYSQSAIYVAAAHALKPNYSVYFFDKVSVAFFWLFMNYTDVYIFCAGLSQCFAISSLNGTVHFVLY
jgi:hypothetical protein